MKRAAGHHTLVLLLHLAGCKAYDVSLLDIPTRAANSVSPGAGIDACDGEDDDGDGIIDEGDTCSAPHAQARCVSGACVIDRCDDGFADCDHLAADGCEESARDSACGPCGYGCAGASAEREPERTPDAAVAVADSDAGASEHDDAGACEDQERCDQRDNDCDGKVDEDPSCGCAQQQPTGQGPACDRCACEACRPELERCLDTGDADWNRLCGSLLRCYGENIQAGNCPDGDCVQGLRGPCGMAAWQAASKGVNCSVDPVSAPCGSLAQLRTACYQTKCSAVCKL